MDAITIKYLIIGILIFDFLVERILDYLNIKNLSAALPSNVADVYDTAEYNRSQEYQKEKEKAEQFQSYFQFALYILLLTQGYLGGLYDYIQASVLQSSLSTYSFYASNLLFFGVLFIASDLISTPFSIYNTFVIEEKYGFNKSTVKLFIMDKIKGYLLAIILGGVIIALLLFLIQTLDTSFWWIFWLIISVLIVTLNMFYTSLLLPLFNKLTPLGDGELKTAIQAYCVKENFPVDNIYIMDGSKRSNKANAFFSGFGKKKKIVLFDTLVDQHSIPELIAILAHEAGHFKKKHIIQMMVLSVFQMGVYLFLLSLLIKNENVSVALGSTGNSIALNLIGFGLLFSPVSSITGILVNVLSRKNEYEADAFAASTSSAADLGIALKNLSKKNLSNLTPHPAYVFLHYSHPPVTQRLDAMGIK
ncbi:M48 family metallopeptidase [Cytophaga hutchinsonii]|jgi:STE24 endopeptidase|uniref:Zn-dependent protease with chaperone function n=1 Tax=Cytophaga hutchinsonii (strain ATCC 33406 / DSM 1761 / CIP 103989 / NBRC 15051 / NCIMB 9469 / D465) TaxID=269798 RepID=A0A6N4SQU3_CYTH3|nr:M48 family metallopeptidase [Cytophaga hutchinsonii]ABG58664.1 Zn-dependent protease with chaperone function [Cytophaga hutchinsonii ATCC 33406]SFX59141.1 STE24 endopeptidase [Cytophaga hutchinsonii ATCC 33406]